MARRLIVAVRLFRRAASSSLLFAAVAVGAELPPEIQVDRLLVQAEREIKDGEHGSAVSTFERILDVSEEHGLEIPTAFWFRQAEVLHAAGLDQRAVEASTRYLTEAGRTGEHYRAALDILDAAEVGLAEARAAEARARASAERAEREAVARAAVVAASVPETVAIPTGTFRMGCLTRRGCDKDEKPVREVRIPAFALAKHETTFAQWDVCVEYGPCRWVSDEGWGRGDRPVVNVGWDDAQAYVGWLSRETGARYRLPSEAEWEYAARAGTTTKYSWGDRIGGNLANCRGCGSQWDWDAFLRGDLGVTAPVGSFAPNRFGLYDYARQRVGVGRGLLERRLCRRPGRRFGSDWRRLQPSACCGAALPALDGGSLRAASRFAHASGSGDADPLTLWNAGYRRNVMGFRVVRALAP